MLALQEACYNDLIARENYGAPFEVKKAAFSRLSYKEPALIILNKPLTLLFLIACRHPAIT